MAGQPLGYCFLRSWQDTFSGWLSIEREAAIMLTGLRSCWQLDMALNHFGLRRECSSIQWWRERP